MQRLQELDPKVWLSTFVPLQKSEGVNEFRQPQEKIHLPLIVFHFSFSMALK